MVATVPRAPPPTGAPQPNEAGGQGKLAPGLWVVATPIGNLGDVSRRAAAVLAEVDLVVCEDTRVTARLLAHLGLKRPLLAYNDHSAARLRPGLLDRLRQGQRLALVSDAGTPCISDPGYRLVREAQEAGLRVRAVPGPSAVLAALSIAGLPTDRFFFAGFLPPRTSARRQALAELATVPATLVFLESGPRLAAMLGDASAVLGRREAAVARELTKLFEEVRRGELANLATAYTAATTPKGEIVVVVGPPGVPPEIEPAALDAALLEAARTLQPRQAALQVGRACGLPSNRLYARLLELRHALPDAG